MRLMLRPWCWAVGSGNALRCGRRLEAETEAAAEGRQEGWPLPRWLRRMVSEVGSRGTLPFTPHQPCDPEAMTLPATLPSSSDSYGTASSGRLGRGCAGVASP